MGAVAWGHSVADLLEELAQRQEVQEDIRDAAMDELQVQRGSIVTWLDADTSDARLSIVPAWQWLLEA